MEPEEEFLENAFTMANYAKLEIQQFLAWTSRNKPYGHTATALLSKLDGLTSEIKALKKEYAKR